MAVIRSKQRRGPIDAARMGLSIAAFHLARLALNLARLALTAVAVLFAALFERAGRLRERARGAGGSGGDSAADFARPRLYSDGRGDGLSEPWSRLRSCRGARCSSHGCAGLSRGWSGISGRSSRRRGAGGVLCAGHGPVGGGGSQCGDCQRRTDRAGRARGDGRREGKVGRRRFGGEL